MIIKLIRYTLFLNLGPENELPVIFIYFYFFLIVHSRCDVAIFSILSLMYSSLFETVCPCSVHALIGLLSVSSGGGRQQETLIGTPLPRHSHPPAGFQLSQTTTVAHHSFSLLCISTTFHINGALKSKLGRWFMTGWIAAGPNHSIHHMLLWALVTFISNLSFTSLP